MITSLVFNPGSNSLKIALVECKKDQRVASLGRKIITISIDDIGKEPRMTVTDNKEEDIKKTPHESSSSSTTKKKVEASDMKQAVRASLDYLRGGDSPVSDIIPSRLSFIGVRVVHGGSKYIEPTRVDDQVYRDIQDLEDLAPLHNRSSLSVFDALKTDMPDVPVFAAFDTAFHHTLPERAWRYAIDRDTADKHGVRKYGFHGLSHRYMLEQYAYSVGKNPVEVNIITTHLESGCSACAIEKGKSIDTTMGLTPLEGLMMGSRCGSIDPAIIPYLARKEGKSIDDIMTFLNKKSGLLGISGYSLDTRELVKRDDERCRLAMDMFGYRVKLAVGSYMAALGTVDAVLLGGGIGEDSPWLREAVCAGLAGWGLILDAKANESIEGMCRISQDDSRLEAWAMPVDEAMQIAHECMHKYMTGEKN
eukprot:TRINITY_DN7739_c0_g1_i1.p1 TRINITY_DN7739_c0_g1~~TRINITY_DN7739_c0_g1_i1.p1  ORF type:complete len:437 (+),score=106.77 TRINITY_DN7739_c0_g1_i1:49-1311(+)